MSEKKKIRDVEKYILDEMADVSVPKSLEPEQMKAKLQEAEALKRKRKRIFAGAGIFAAAACMVIAVGSSFLGKDTKVDKQVQETFMEANVEEEVDSAAENKKMYERIYSHMEAKNHTYEYMVNGNFRDGAVVMEESIETEWEAPAEEPAADMAVEELATTKGTGAANGADFAGTNLQVEFVDEGDIVKNDGRYLYQLLQGEDYNQSILQIIDTQDGLKELSRIEGFRNIDEFYIWEDMVVVIERLWAETQQAKKLYGGYFDSSYSKLHFYDISDKTAPKEVHSFTLKGSYKTSRISDGYLYFITGYSVGAPEEDKPETFIPIVDGKVLEHDALYLPEDTDATSYLLMISIDLKNPAVFADKMAVVSGGNYYYVSSDNIYVLDVVYEDYSQSGYQCEQTRIVRFSYENGQIEAEAEGSVDGMILDQFAMDEYEEHFRIITTVSPVNLDLVVDDFSGETIGYDVEEYLTESNSVYVLDEQLKKVGSIEKLAEDELVYSARFMGDTGYFVTFRQMDPLFSVDFSDPANPKILGELKISGFSEYLHFYGENMLLGIGYEADEETGRQEGIKLSMFDISNPADVKEINKLVMEEYDYSDAFYNHHAVLVSPGKNVIGFLSEGYGNDEYLRDYNVYSYDANGGFAKTFSLDCAEEDYGYHQVRGTYIGDVFYLLRQDAGASAYDIKNGEMLEELP